MYIHEYIYNLQDIVNYSQVHVYLQQHTVLLYLPCIYIFQIFHAYINISDFFTYY